MKIVKCEIKEINKISKTKVYLVLFIKIETMIEFYNVIKPI